MQMSGIWICMTYTHSFLFRGRSGFCELRIFLCHSGDLRPGNTICATYSSVFSSICCVNPSFFDLVRRGGKGRFVYSLTVVHFRKLVNRQKIGSPGKADTVIPFRSYKPDCNCIWLKLHNEKDDGVTNSVITVCVLKIENMHQ